MSRRSQDIPIRPRYGYTEEEQLAGAALPHQPHPASSYTEIPFLSRYPGPVPEQDNNITPTAHSIGPPGFSHLDSGEEDDELEAEYGDEEESNSNSGEPLPTSHDPSQMRHFVAHNLEAKLRESAAAAAALATTDSEHTTPSTSLTHRFLQSRNVPEIDGNVLSDIELEAQYLASSVDNLLENLSNLLHSISSITADNVEVHKNAVNKLTDTLDANIKCQYQLLAKAEEITKSMKPTEQLGQRIREIKRLVDMLDSTM